MSKEIRDVPAAKARKRICYWTTRQPWLVMLWYYFVALAALLVSQGIFAAVNADLFNVHGGMEWWRIVLGNVRFASSCIAIFMLPAIAVACVALFVPRWQHGLCVAFRWLYGIAMGAMLAANVADTPYYRWTFRRMTWDIFSYLGNDFNGQWYAMAVQFLRDFWPYFLLFFALLALVLWSSGRMRLASAGAHRRRWYGNAAVAVLLLGILFLLIRNNLNFRGYPLRPMDANHYASSDNSALVISSPYSIFRTRKHTSHINRLNFYPDEASLEAVFTPVHTPAPAVAVQAVLDKEGNVMPITKNNRPNVVLIILESFGKEYIDGGWASFVDSLSRIGTSLRGMANGQHSIESVPSLLSGIPALMEEHFITSTYAADRLLSLPQYLKAEGYNTAFFHGAYNGSMNFDSYASRIGIEDYYGMNEYRNPKLNPRGEQEGDFDGVWGIVDDKFLQFAAYNLGHRRQPFFATLYTISSHHPYYIPPQYAGRFPQGPIDILQAVSYADFSLRCFFDSVKSQPWYSNTLFVITADHAVQPLGARYRVGPGKFMVPMILYWPDHTILVPGGHRNAAGGIESRRVMQQADLMPTLLDLLGIAQPCVAYGRSAFDTTGSFHAAFLGNYHLLTREDRVLTYDGTAFRSYDYTTDTLLQHPLPTVNASDEALLKAVLQQYNNRIIDNRLMADR